MALLQYPKKVVLGDITVRDGFQHEEKFIPTDAKLWLAEELILAGFKRIEVTNFGNPKVMPQFKDADELSKRLNDSKKVGHLLKDVEITAITIRERAVDRTIQARKEGYGPDRILFMVSTSESHHRTNSGLSLDEYWKMCETYIPKAHDAGMKVCGTVSTIWGCPL
ncbi:MAG: pyruvate carboxyltransferase, partial [Desulfobacteraceae bacterium]|nr:pyruvate carboxyltransferase [Desulfobacteraceae bacterium]